MRYAVIGAGLFIGLAVLLAANFGGGKQHCPTLVGFIDNPQRFNEPAPIRLTDLSRRCPVLVFQPEWDPR